MPEKKDISHKAKSETKNDDTLGVHFAAKEEEALPKKPGPEIYETANKHLAPSEVPGKPEEDVFNVTRAFDEDAFEMGTIVSDKKRKRTPLGKTLKSAFGEWWGKTRKSLDGGIDLIEEKLEEKEPEETPGKEDRSKTIEKAKEHTAQPPKEDHHVIIEKSKTLPKDAERVKGVPYKIVDTPPEPPKWNDTETTKGKVLNEKEKVADQKETVRVQKPDLRKDMVAPVVTKRIKKSIHSYNTEEDKKENGKKWEVKDLKNTKAVEKKKIEEPDKKEVTLPPIKPKKKGFARPFSSVFISPKVTKHSDYVEKKDEKEPVSHKVTPKKPTPVSQPVETTLSKPAPVQKTLPEQQPQEPPEKPETKQPPKTKPIVPTTRKVEAPDHDVQMRIQSKQVAPLQTKKGKWGKVIRIIIILFIVGLGVVLAIFAVSKLNIFEKSPDQVPGVSQPIEPLYIPSFFEPDFQKPITLSGNKQQFFSTLRGMVDTSSVGVTQFYPKTQSETVLQNPSTWQIFQTLNTRLPQSTIRSLDATSMFGSVFTNSPAPFIIIRSYNFDTLFSGFLEWEQYMYDDLAPLFGVAPLESIIFKDGVKNNSSVRVLYNEIGDEVLLYAFVNRNTVVITSSSEALTKIVDRF